MIPSGFHSGESNSGFSTWKYLRAFIQLAVLSTFTVTGSPGIHTRFPLAATLLLLVEKN